MMAGAHSILVRLPCCPDAEIALLGWIILNGSQVREVLDHISPDDFFPGPNRQILLAIVKLANESKIIDLVTICDAVHDDPEVQAVGGPAYVAKLVEGIHDKAPLGQYIEMVRHASSRRVVLRYCESISQATLANAPFETIGALMRGLLSSLDLPKSNGLVAVSESQILQMDLPGRPMILEPIIAAQSLNMIHSGRGVGKTFIGLGMAHAIASGRTFLRWKAPQPMRVLYVDGEMPAADLRARLAAIVAGAEQPAEMSGGGLQLITPDFQEGPMPDLATTAGQVRLEPHLEGIKVLFLDNLSCLARSGRENEGESWLTMQTWSLQNRQRGISTIFLHHSGKSGLQRGTSRREDMLDLVMHLTHPTDYTPSEGLRAEVHFEKCRALLGEDVNPFEVRLGTAPTGEAIWTMRDLCNVLADRAQELYKQGHSVREVAELLSVSKSKAHRLKNPAGDW
jgi:hypothetical protein